MLLLNGSHDREASGLFASGFASRIMEALNRTYGDPGKSLKKLLMYPRSSHLLITHIVFASFLYFLILRTAESYCYMRLVICACVTEDDNKNIVDSKKTSFNYNLFTNTYIEQLPSNLTCREPTFVRGPLLGWVRMNVGPVH